MKRSAMHLLADLSFLAASAAQPARCATLAMCTAPEYRQFDFWIGDWDVFESGGADSVARMRVDRILDGCVLREDYQEQHGLHGQSFSLYDGPAGSWRQIWVTNQGRLLLLAGNLSGGEMVLSGVDRSSGKEQLVRGTWKIEGEAVRETAEISTDGGKTWKTWFDLLLRRHRALG